MIRLGILRPQVTSRLVINSTKHTVSRQSFRQFASLLQPSLPITSSKLANVPVHNNERHFSSMNFLHINKSSPLQHGHMSSNSPSEAETAKKGAPNAATGTNNESSAEKKLPSISELRILKDLFKYIWPSGNNKVRIRVIIALSLLIGAKLLNVQVPFFFKQTIDSMNVDWSDATVALPAAITLTIFSYGVARFGSVLFGELRNAIFAKVAQNAIRTVSLETFKHLMKLDLGWHLSRQTGGLTRAMDRGTKGISYVLSAMVFHIIPISFEISVV